MIVLFSMVNSNKVHDLGHPWPQAGFEEDSAGLKPGPPPVTLKRAFSLQPHYLDVEEKNEK